MTAERELAFTPGLARSLGGQTARTFIPLLDAKEVVFAPSTCNTGPAAPDVLLLRGERERTAKDALVTPERAGVERRKMGAAGRWRNAGGALPLFAFSRIL